MHVSVHNVPVHQRTDSAGRVRARGACYFRHDLFVLDQHPGRCALGAYARRHVGDTTMSNRARPAAHHDATVHLVPRYWPEAMMEALVADERSFVRLLVGAPRPSDRYFVMV